MHLGSEGSSRKQLALTGVASWLQVHIQLCLEQRAVPMCAFPVGKAWLSV